MKIIVNRYESVHIHTTSSEIDVTSSKIFENQTTNRNTATISQNQGWSIENKCRQTNGIENKLKSINNS